MRHPAPAPADDELVGEVVWVVFTNPDSGFGVIELDGEGDAEGARASGPLADLSPGQPVRLLGAWTDHPRHGRTFAAVAYEHAPPRSPGALQAFLASDRFPGVGDVLAARLVEAFGLELDQVIANDPRSLATVQGVSPRLADAIASAWSEAGALADVVRRFSDAGLAARLAQAAHRLHGDEVLEVLDADPYRLLEVRGAGWDHAERLARHAGVARDDPRRLRAGAVAAHRDACGRGGHVTLDDAELVAAAGRLLGVDAITVRTGIDAAAAADELVSEEVPGAADRTRWYRPADLHAERSVADDVDRLLAGPSRLAAAVRRGIVDDELTPEQQAAATAALSRGVSLLTGGPGTGKTRTIQAILDACEAVDLNVALCAPTGRAAKRMEEVTGRGASTIHRLLEARPEPGAGFVFGYDRDRRLPHDLVIADEWSMTDLHLARALLAAVDDGAHLLCVGDAHQLPPVGPGAVLRDLLAVAEDAGTAVGSSHGAESGGGEADTGATPGRTGAAPSPRPAAARLTFVHRQAAASRIVTLAHDIDRGAVGELSGRDGDVFCVPQSAPGLPARVAEIVAVRAPGFFGCEPSEVQVLAAMYRGPGGVDALNDAVKERVNPAAGRTPVAGFHEGDRVLQTRNDADRDIANGDIGEVVVADVADRRLEVAFPTGTVEASGDALDDLRPAWALTVHKSQGGEWPVVVLVLDRSQRAMLRRELVYTAVTRARVGLLLVGEIGLVAEAARRADGGLLARRTGLADRLTARFGVPATPIQDPMGEY